MISGRNNRSAYVFTASQWQELEQQLLTFKYLMSGIPVPPELISTLISTYHPFASSSSSSSSSRLFPNHHTLPFGWGCYQMGYGKKIDPEPGRCRRTDGKKWRCTKEACPDSKYCERHMHRGKNKSKKTLHVFSTSNSTAPPPLSLNSTPLDTSVILSPPGPTVANLKTPSFAPPPPPPPQTTNTYPHYYKNQKLQSTSFSPFLSPNHDHNYNHNKDQPSSYSLDFTESTQHNSGPHWLSDPLPYDQPKKEIRYTNEMKGTSVGERILGPLEDIGYNTINKDVKEERFGFDTRKDDDETTQKQFFHHFLGD